MEVAMWGKVLVAFSLRFSRLMRSALVLGCISACIAANSYAAFPERPVRLVIPWPAGATTDALGREFARQLGEKLGESTFVENRGGANGMIGTESVARARPDGYTLLFTTSEPISINGNLYKSIPYDVEIDLEPVAFVGRTYFVFAARADFPANDMQQLIKLAKQKPKDINVGSYGIADLFLGSLESLTGTEFMAIPYQGAGPAITAVLGGQVDLTFAASFSAAQHLTGGRIKLLGVGSAERLSFIPNVPTFIEQGIAGYEIGNWLAVFAPRGLDATARAKLTEAIAAVVKSKAFEERARSMGVKPELGNGEYLADVVRKDMARWAKVAKDKNIDKQ
jgi:tripartite-type tricarboxylate transporter receptor subunit TctC